MRFVLDAYAARSCPLKTVHAFTPELIAPSLTRPTPRWFHNADEVESGLFEHLLDAGALDLRDLREQPSEVQERACVAAMRNGVDVIIGGLLPRDYDNHRSGRPSLLVRSPDGSGYHPVQVKFHKVTEQAPEETELEVSTLEAPRVRSGLRGRAYRWSGRLNAALQVSHYWRLLEASGFAAAAPEAGLIGLERLQVGEGGPQRQLIAWLDLNADVVAPNPRMTPVPEAASPISVLDRYEAEHAFRVRLAEQANAASGDAPLLTPIVSPECAHCAWQRHCLDQLDDDDLSLRISKAPLDVFEILALRDLGVSTVAHLAAMELDEVLGEYLPRVSHRPGGEQRLRVAQRRARMLSEGIVLERQTEGPIDLPRHELEIDIDIETNRDDRAYLWGFLVDDGAGEPVYREFSAFAELDADAEARLAAEAFAWLRGLVDGRDAAVYHYSDYEVVRINRLTGNDSDVDAWMREFTRQHLVDLFQTVRQNFFGANGLGLKVVATAGTDFAWRDATPGGLESLEWFDEAVEAPDADTRAAARRRVLEYNEDDVRATWHLRRWLREQ